MMTSEIFKSVDLSKTQKSKYIKNASFSLIKKMVRYTLRAK